MMVAIGRASYASWTSTTTPPATALLQWKGRADVRGCTVTTDLYNKSQQSSSHGYAEWIFGFGCGQLLLVRENCDLHIIVMDDPLQVYC